MKKLSSVFYMWVGLGFGILAVLMMFVPTVYAARTLSAAQMFWGYGQYGGAWPAFMGYMFILIGALMTGVMALPFIQPSVKTEKIVLISSLVLTLAGMILVGLIYVEYSANNGPYRYFDYFLAGYYLTLIFAAILAACDVMALVLDW